MSTVHFYINKEDSVKKVQENFSLLFPFLKINFFKTRGNNKTNINQSILFCPEVKMIEMNKNLEKGEIEIGDATTVSQLESGLFDRFGLTAQVARKSGNLWMPTSMTDSWTLREQNEHGKEISNNQGNLVCFREVPYGC
ncbi:MAG TPA: hypothetical protein VMH01_10560 [Puia sp.]|nr:hypothetical protein [Puia sp.]